MGWLATFTVGSDTPFMAEWTLAQR
jgi:hypothetical protein